MNALLNFGSRWIFVCLIGYLFVDMLGESPSEVFLILFYLPGKLHTGRETDDPVTIYLLLT